LRLLSRRWRRGDGEPSVPYGPSPAPPDADVGKARR
jgi:hypothetical protein